MFARIFQQKVEKSASFRDKTRKLIDFSKTLNFSSKSPSFGVLTNFSEKSCKKCLISWKKTRNHRFGQDSQLFEQITTFRRFHELIGKNLKTVLHFPGKHVKSSIWPTLATFRTNHHVLGVLTNFSAKACKKCLISRENTKSRPPGQKSQLFEQTTMIRCFDELFSKNLRKMPHFVRKHEISSIWQERGTFWTNHHASTFWQTFEQKVAKRASCREKTREIIDLTKTVNFTNKLPRFGVLMNFSAESCNKCLISWQNTKNHRFRKNSQLFEQTTTFRHFDELLSGKLQQVSHFVTKHEKSSTSQKLSTFRANYHVSAFWRTFQQKVAKSASFREKTRKIIDLAETCDFSSKSPRFGILTNFSAKSRKKSLISRENTTTRKFALKLELFKQITTFWCFDELFSKRSQKEPHFLKKEEK